MRKILDFSLCMILALSLTNGSITANAQVEDMCVVMLEDTEETNECQNEEQSSVDVPTEEVAPELPVETEAPEVTESPVETEAPEVTESPMETEAPEVTESPVDTEAPEVTESPVDTEAPVVLESAVPVATATVTPAMTEAPEVEAVVPVETTKAVFYVLNSDLDQPEEPLSHPTVNYSKVGVGVVEAEFVADDKEAVADGLVEIPFYDPIQYGLSLDWYIQWYVIKLEVDGWHVDGIWATCEPEVPELPVVEFATESPVVTKGPGMATNTPEATVEPEVVVVPTITPEETQMPVIVVPATVAPRASVEPEVTEVASNATIATEKTEVVNANNEENVEVTTTPIATSAIEAPTTTSQPEVKEEQEVIIEDSEVADSPVSIVSDSSDSEVIQEVTTEAPQVTASPVVAGELVDGVVPETDIIIEDDILLELPSVELSEDEIAGDSATVDSDEATGKASVIEDAEVDEGQDTAVEKNSTKKEKTTEVPEDQTPSSAVTLPQTGVVSESLFYLIGGLLCALGVSILAISKRNSNS